MRNIILILCLIVGLNANEKFNDKAYIDSLHIKSIDKLDKLIANYTICGKNPEVIRLRARLFSGDTVTIISQYTKIEDNNITKNIDNNTTNIAINKDNNITQDTNSTNTILVFVGGGADTRVLNFGTKESYIQLSYINYNDTKYDIDNTLLNIYYQKSYKYADVYVGAGAGYSKLKILKSNFIVDDSSSSSFVYGVDCKISTKITKHINIFVGYISLNMNHLSNRDDKDITLIDNISRGYGGVVFSF